MDRGLTVAVALLLVTAGCAGVTLPGTDDTPGTTATTPSTDAPTSTEPAGTETPEPGDSMVPSAPDPPEDRLGWEDGYWYNESISVDESDGLNETELDAVVSRAMARVEEIRRLEFEERVPVNVISRTEYAANQTGGNYSARYRLHENTRWEAMFMIDEQTDAIETQESNTAASVGGYYSPASEEIVIVSENTSSPKMNEITLAQELFHALQGQTFDAYTQPWYPGRTTEEHNAADGLIEGDGNYVDYLYEQRCDSGWTCLLPDESGNGGPASDINIGLLQVTLQPYSDGPAMVRDIQQEEGWDAVNDLYENPPASTEQVIHPERYGEDAPNYPTVEASSSGGWVPLDMGPNQIDHASFGEAGLATMMWYPSYLETANVVVDYNEFINPNAGGINQYNYDLPVTDGWDGDRLVPYVTEGSAETGETGYVWKINWDSEDDATEFVDGYEQLLSYHGAEPVDGRENVYRIPDGNGFADAFHVQQDGDTVTIVNAPTVAELEDVHSPAGE